MKYLISIIMLISLNTFASYKVMSFNTTCSSICEKGNYDKFKKRKHWIVDTINRHSPDLIGLQEVLTHKQLNWIQSQLADNYYLVYYRNLFIFRYADPAILFKTSKFDLDRLGGFWLGPKGYRFSLGWKRALPRRVQWTRLIDKESQKEFYFITSHFDNRKKNKENSAKVLLSAFQEVNIPIIFAADTNLKPETNGYNHLTGFFTDSFNIKENFTLIKNSETDIHHSCNIEKGEIFPDCRVDHVMLDRNHPWKVLNWTVDQFVYGVKQRFTSDHRALIVDIKL